MELTLDEALQKGIEAHKTGQIQDAERLYTAILQAQPNHPDANHNMGVLAVGVGKIQEALPFFKIALETKPSTGQFWLSYINALIKLDRIANAKVVFDQAKGQGLEGEWFDQLEKRLFDTSPIVVKLQDPPSDQLQSIAKLYSQGQLGQVLSVANQMLEKFPNSIILHNMLGASNAGLKQFGAAVDNFKKVLKIDPNDAIAYNNMGSALQDMGNAEAAIDCYKNALKINPDFCDAYNNMGNAFRNMGNTEAAIDRYNMAIKIRPDYAEAYNNMGHVLKDKGDLDAAIGSYKKAIKIRPNYAEAYNNMGIIQQEKGECEAAIESCSEALKIEPDYAEAYNNMGAALNYYGDSEAAIESYQQALKIKPDYAEAYNNMGVVLSEKGDTEAAIESYKQALKIKPNYAEAYKNLSGVYFYKDKNEYFFKMQRLCLDSSITDEQQCHLNFALSKASEDLNEIDQSFTYLKIGNELRKKTLSYDIKEDIKLFSQLKKSYPSIAKVALQSASKTSELKPVFILGMPRSGTTLVEQIISSHSEVTGAGELGYVKRFGQSIAQGLIKPNTGVISNFRQSYIESLKKIFGAGSIVTDKMPLNFLYVGLIFSAFPDAKVIHVHRNPAATCWSNYKHYFSSKGLGYSYDLDDVVTYLGLYKDLMELWQGHYRDRIYNLNYDSLTINQEDETRKLIQHLDLGWENSCLSPQSNKRSVRTVSHQQVRKKVYQGSSQQWRKFEPYLNGAFDQLNVLNWPITY